MQPATAHHYYTNAGTLITAQTGPVNTSNLSSANNGSSSLLTTAAITALVDENGTMTSSALTPTSLDYQGKRMSTF